MNKYKVLVFPAMTEIANEILASLENNKTFELVFAASDVDCYIDVKNNKPVHNLPYVTEPDFSEKLNDLLDAQSIEFIIPAHDDVAYTLSEKQTILNAKVIGQNKSINNIVRYKDKTYQFFTGIIPVPEVYEAPEVINDFPIFAKPKKGQGSQNIFRLDNKSELKHFCSKEKSTDFVFTEYLPNSEYTIDCFSQHGELHFSGPRTRDKTIKGISVRSRLVPHDKLQRELESYARIISNELKLHGLWFFQMKADEHNQLKLLEIGARVSGTMMLNRVRGINFVELALYQALGNDIEVITNSFEVSLVRTLIPRFKHDIEYRELFIDFDDTLYIDEKFINTDIIKLIFEAKNQRKAVHLITKNKKNNLASTLHEYGLSHVFDSIIHISPSESKVNHLSEGAVLIDDSFSERKAAIEAGAIALGIDAVKLLLG